jgi:hypothetical protein
MQIGIDMRASARTKQADADSANTFFPETAQKTFFCKKNSLDNLPICGILPTLQIWSEAWLSPAWIWGHILVRD